MTLKLVRLELARNSEFPNGSRQHGYQFVAPLDHKGHLDAAEWAKERDRCRVRRFWAGQPHELGRLVRRRGGAWVFDYNPATEPTTSLVSNLTNTISCRANTYPSPNATIFNAHFALSPLRTSIDRARSGLRLSS